VRSHSLISGFLTEKYVSGSHARKRRRLVRAAFSVIFLSVIFLSFPGCAWLKEFAREGQEDVQFGCECRGPNAQAWFALDSLVLEKH